MGDRRLKCVHGVTENDVTLTGGGGYEKWLLVVVGEAGCGPLSCLAWNEARFSPAFQMKELFAVSSMWIF